MKQYQFLHDCITPNLSEDFKKEYQFIYESIMRENTLSNIGKVKK